MKKPVKAGRNSPSRREEEELFSRGYRRVAGLDEAGRGALAGPVVAAAVILPPEADFPWLGRVKDSKLLARGAREEIFSLMLEARIEIGLGIIPSAVIDAINILKATQQAMQAALSEMGEPPDYVLTDAVNLPGLRAPQRNIVKGDRTCLSIACASVAAKVTRDRIMGEMHALYPCYGFGVHKGYGTAAHMKSLLDNGACEIHRRSFRPVRELERLI